MKLRRSSQTEPSNQGSYDFLAELENYSWVWAGWINPPYTKTSEIIAIRGALRARPEKPLLLKEFLREEQAAKLSEIVRNIALWKRVHAVLVSSGAVEEVEESHWSSVPAEERWYRHDMARPIDGLIHGPESLVGKDREFFENFLVFTIFGPVFRSWLSTVLGRSLDPLAALEIARYQEGDFIVPHSDFIDSKVLGVNIYLDKDWNAKKGGCLNFINGAGQTYALEPRYNSLSLIPIAHDCFHSVAPWKSTRPGRYTVSLGYRLPEPTSATGLDELRN